MARSALLAGGLMLMASCTSVTPSLRPTEGGTVTPVISPTPPRSLVIDHPGGPTDVVLRMSIIGGLRYPGSTVELPPTFTLYGDGRVIYLIEHPRPDDAPAIELRQARLTEEQLAALVENAVGRGGLANARDYYGDVPIADDVTTNFEVHAFGVDKNVAVYALGYTVEDVPDQAARAAFQVLADGLRQFADEVEAGGVEDLGAFAPEAYLVTLDHPIGSPDDLVRDWPWDELQLDDFPANGGYRVRVVTPEQAARVADSPMSAPNDIVVAAPDGNNYLVRLRPLLPDEIP